MTIRTATLERQPVDLLLARLRKAPDCATTRPELQRRGLGHLMPDLAEEAHERWLERAGSVAIANELETALVGVSGSLA
jgi:hypothetical protein